jgi:hypothetical protein
MEGTPTTIAWLVFFFISTFQLRSQIETSNMDDFGAGILSRPHSFLSFNFGKFISLMQLMEFWTNETRVSPNKWDVMKHRIMKNRWEKHVIRSFEEPHVHSSNFFQFDSFCNCFIFCFNLLHCLWLFMGLGPMVVKDIIIWKHMFTISSNWSSTHLRLSS